MTPAPLNLLITGTSHVGKSSLATGISKVHDIELLQTDKLGRHPGRPWPRVKPFIGEFFGKLSAETVFQFLLIHHQNMWRYVEPLIQNKMTEGKGFVFEGCALRPEYIDPLLGESLQAVCLTADDAFITDRIHASSEFETLAAEHQRIVSAFIDRSLRDNALQAEKAAEYGIPCVDVSDPDALQAFEHTLRLG